MNQETQEMVLAQAHGVRRLAPLQTPGNSSRFLTQNGEGTRDQKNDNHRQRDDELGEHGANVPEQTSPPSAASVNHAFACD